MLMVLTWERFKELGCIECIFFSIGDVCGCNHPGAMIRMSNPLECDSRRVKVKGMTEIQKKITQILED